VEDMEAFARLVTALRPWLGQLVVVGGWAHRLHRFHRLATPPDHLPLRTRDTDLAFSTEEALAGDLRAALADAGFTEQLFGDDAPPATHYGLGEEDDGFYAEFLTPLFGSEMKRGKPDATVRTAGITAQKLRYLDLLLLKPWSVRVEPQREVPIAADVELFVANPTTFIVQKLLIHSDRPPHKKAQDILYIHDTLELFGGSLGELRGLWLKDVRSTMPSKTARRSEAVACELFAEVTDTIREAARIPQDRRLAPDNVQRACRYGLEEVLGIPEAD
jgi:nucleotidyltransferase-like protein